jgi:hypothetical protein
MYEAAESASPTRHMRRTFRFMTACGTLPCGCASKHCDWKSTRRGGELPPIKTVMKLALHYMIKPKAYLNTPARGSVFFSGWNFESQPHTIPPLEIRMQSQLSDVSIRLEYISKCVISDTGLSIYYVRNKFTNPLIMEVVSRVNCCINGESKLAFIWLPSHVRLTGNASVDTVAKAAQSLTAGNKPVLYTDFF